MITSIFLSHTSIDKPFVRKLARDLESHGVKYWLDEAEIKVGESLIDKIRQGLDGVSYVAAIISPNSITSSWVLRELDVAMNQEINNKSVKVLPIMYQHCELPGFLLGKLYADFTDESKYVDAFKRLVESIGIVFNRTALEPDLRMSTLGDATNKAFIHNLPILPRPFHRPFQYLGQSVSEVSRLVGYPVNSVGKIIIDTEDCHMFLEAEGSLISFVEVDLKKTAPFFCNKEFDPEPMLGALSINPSELELARSKTHCHTYYDHRKKIKINVMCTFDGGPISVAFSTKYYGM